MKELLLFMACMIATVALHAQDIIVKKNGTTIQAKVLRVTTDEVKYKAYSNQNGPTLSIRINDLLAINYEDGEKETFNSSASSNSIVTNETATSFSNDQKLLNTYHGLRRSQMKVRARRLKLSGYIVGGSLMVAGIVMIGVGDQWSDCEEKGREFGTLTGSGVGIFSAGLTIGLSCIIIGNQLAKRSIYTSSLWDTRFDFNNGSSINLGVDALSDNTVCNKTLGIGLRYNF